MRQNAYYQKSDRCGSSRAVTLPKTWLEFFERQLGKSIDFVAIEVNRTLTIVPYVPDKESAKSDFMTQAQHYSWFCTFHTEAEASHFAKYLARSLNELVFLFKNQMQLVTPREA